MQIGLSSYSVMPLLQDGSMSIERLFEWAASIGAEHIELVPFAFAPPGAGPDYEFADDTPTLERIAAASQSSGLPISGLCIGANFVGLGAAERQAEISRVNRYADLCSRFGARLLRHDVVTWARRLADTAEFEREFQQLVDATRDIADHAAARSVVTSVEDHGFFMNSSERIKRLMHAVDRPNFRLTVDVGNFLCVDEDPLMGTRACLPHASIVHLKDFYVRRTSPGPGWLETFGGQYIRGSVFGFGDLDTETILRSVTASGYDGFLSLEYEGNEPALFGCETGLANIRTMLAKVGD